MMTTSTANTATATCSTVNALTSLTARVGDGGDADERLDGLPLLGADMLAVHEAPDDVCGLLRPVLLEQCHCPGDLDTGTSRREADEDCGDGSAALGDELRLVPPPHRRQPRAHVRGGRSELGQRSTAHLLLGEHRKEPGLRFTVSRIRGLEQLSRGRLGRERGEALAQ